MWPSQLKDTHSSGGEEIVDRFLIIFACVINSPYLRKKLLNREISQISNIQQKEFRIRKFSTLSITFQVGKFVN